MKIDIEILDFIILNYDIDFMNKFNYISLSFYIINLIVIFYKINISRICTIFNILVYLY